MAKPTWVSYLQDDLDIDDIDVPSNPASASWDTVKIDYLLMLLGEYENNVGEDDDPKILAFVNNVIDFVSSADDDETEIANLLNKAQGLASKSYRIGQEAARTGCNVCKYALRSYDTHVAAASRAASRLYDVPADALASYKDFFLDLL